MESPSNSQKQLVLAAIAVAAVLVAVLVALFFWANAAAKAYGNALANWKNGAVSNYTKGLDATFANLIVVGQTETAQQHDDQEKQCQVITDNFNRVGREPEGVPHLQAVPLGSLLNSQYRAASSKSAAESKKLADFRQKVVPALGDLSHGCRFYNQLIVIEREADQYDQEYKQKFQVPYGARQQLDATHYTVCEHQDGCLPFDRNRWPEAADLYQKSRIDAFNKDVELFSHDCFVSDLKAMCQAEATYYQTMVVKYWQTYVDTLRQKVEVDNVTGSYAAIEDAAKKVFKAAVKQAYPAVNVEEDNYDLKYVVTLLEKRENAVKQAVDEYK